MEIAERIPFAMLEALILNHIDQSSKAYKARKLYQRLKKQPNISMRFVIVGEGSRSRSVRTVSIRSLIQSRILMGHL